MKITACASVMFVCLISAAFAAEEGWLTDFEQAKKEAAEKNRPILVDFSGSDWCGWCIKLESEVFSKKEFNDFAKDSLVLLQVDFPRRKEQTDEQKHANETLARRYAVQGLPTVLLLDAEGKELARTGYRPGGAENYVKHLKDLMEKAGYGKK